MTTTPRPAKCHEKALPGAALMKLLQRFLWRSDRQVMPGFEGYNGTQTLVWS